MPALNNRVRETCVAFLAEVGLSSKLAWILTEIETATGWEEAKRRCLGKMHARTGEILLAWDAPARELLVAQQVITAILWASPLGGRRDELWQREADVIALFAQMREAPKLTLVDPEQLRRRDPAFQERCLTKLTGLRVGGVWRASPVADSSLVFVWHVMVLRGMEYVAGAMAQTAPFRFPAP